MLELGLGRLNIEIYRRSFHQTEEILEATTGYQWLLTAIENRSIVPWCNNRSKFVFKQVAYQPFSGKLLQISQLQATTRWHNLGLSGDWLLWTKDSSRLIVYTVEYDLENFLSHIQNTALRIAGVAIKRAPMCPSQSDCNEFPDGISYAAFRLFHKCDA